MARFLRRSPMLREQIIGHHFGKEPDAQWQNQRIIKQADDGDEIRLPDG